MGLAILVTLYAKSCQVSVFSFQVATGLAFFSLVLHLSTLAVLRNRIAQNRTPGSGVPDSPP